MLGLYAPEAIRSPNVGNAEHPAMHRTHEALDVELIDGCQCPVAALEFDLDQESSSNDSIKSFTSSKESIALGWRRRAMMRWASS